jgi:hypothetical protein
LQRLPLAALPVLFLAGTLIAAAGAGYFVLKLVNHSQALAQEAANTTITHNHVHHMRCACAARERRRAGATRPPAHPPTHPAAPPRRALLARHRHGH